MSVKPQNPSHPLKHARKKEKDKEKGSQKCSWVSAIYATMYNSANFWEITMPDAAPRSSRIFLARFLIGSLMVVTFLSCSSLTSENTFGSLPPSTTSTITGTHTPSWSISTSTVTPPIIEFQSLNPGETPAVVRGIINAPDSTLNVYAGPGHGFPLLGNLNNKVVVNVIGKSHGGWLYVLYSDPDSELTGWVVDQYVLIEEDDLNKIGFVQIVTPTEPPFLP